MSTGLLKKYDGIKLLGDISSSNLLLLNVIYQRPIKATNWKDYAYIILKDVTTGEKKLVTIQDPEMLIYFVKPEYRNYTYYPAHKPLSQCYQKLVKYRKVIDVIAEEAGEEGKRFFEKCKEVNRDAARNLHKYPYVLASDYDYPNIFRVEWLLHYHNPDIRLDATKMFLDIEVDSIDVPGFPKPGQCPINAVSVIDEEGSTVHVFLLRNKNNPLIDEFENTVTDFVEECHNSFDESYGRLNYKIYMFDEEKEINLIQQVFALINTLKRDFLLIWNMSFDIPYIIERIKALGYNPWDIMCSPDFKTKICDYRKDVNNYDWKVKNDVFILSSYTVFLDQMGQYIKIRKGKSELKSVKLNAIAKKELEDEKLDYSDEANIKTLPYVNYKKFVLYNIKDTLLQMGIERRTHDTDNSLLSALSNAVQYQNLFSQTIVLKSYAYVSYYLQGYIIGNNKNVNYGEAREKEKKAKRKDFEGALVCDPMLNDYVGIKLFGRPSKFIFKHVIDYDFTSHYPIITGSHNINQETMIGKIILDGYESLNPDPNDVLYDQGKMFIEALLSRDYSFIGNTYFNLPTTEDLLRDLEERSL